LSASISKVDIDWLIELFLKENPELENYELDPEKERKFLSRFNSFLYPIQHDKPSDIRAYVEKNLEEKEYDKKLSELGRHIWNLELGQDEKYDNCQKDLEKLLEQANKVLPGYSESRGRQISEIRGDLRALRTGGKMGSTRMVQRIVFAEIAKKEPKKNAVKKSGGDDSYENKGM